MRRSSSSSSAGIESISIRSFDGGLVDQIDRFVGKESIGDVTVREDRSCDERGVLELDAVMNLVPLAQSAQDADRVLEPWARPTTTG